MKYHFATNFLDYTSYQSKEKLLDSWENGVIGSRNWTGEELEKLEEYGK